MIERPDKSCGYAFNIGNPNNNIQIKELAELMINLFSNITGKPKGTTVEVSFTQSPECCMTSQLLTFISRFPVWSTTARAMMTLTFVSPPCDWSKSR